MAWSALALGLVQGLTEFLPISSSGHLVLLHQLWPNVFVDSLSFDIWLHGGTLVALVIYFWKDIKKLVVGAFSRQPSADRRLAWQIVLATIPVIIATVLGANKIEDIVRSPLVVALMFILGAILIIFAEHWGKKSKDLTSLTWSTVILIGLSQILALVPGLSRSGILIVVGLFFGLRREAATQFAFLLALPTLLGAVVFDLPHLFGQADIAWSALIIGLAAAAVFGYLAIDILFKWVKTKSLMPFAWYRIILAVVILLTLWKG